MPHISSFALNEAKLNLFEEDVYRDLQKWERCASP